MPFYKNADQLYHCFQELFRQIDEKSPKSSQAILKARLFIRFNCIAPAAEISINARKRPPEITYGSSKGKPELDVTLNTDTLHGILLGELSLRKCVANKEVKVKGPAFKALTLIEIFDQSKKIYPKILKEQGLLE